MDHNFVDVADYFVVNKLQYKYFEKCFTLDTHAALHRYETR